VRTVVEFKSEEEEAADRIALTEEVDALSAREVAGALMEEERALLRRMRFRLRCMEAQARQNSAVEIRCAEHVAAPPLITHPVHPSVRLSTLTPSSPPPHPLLLSIRHIFVMPCMPFDPHPPKHTTETMADGQIASLKTQQRQASWKPWHVYFPDCIQAVSCCLEHQAHHRSASSPCATRPRSSLLPSSQYPAAGQAK
jgi:hypothetical protein